MTEPPLILEIRVPRENEYTPASASALFSSLCRTLSNSSFLGKLTGLKNDSFALEIATVKQQIRFFAIINPTLLSYFESQILAAYPLAVLIKSPDHLSNLSPANLTAGQMIQGNSFYYPIKTFQDSPDTDPLNSPLAVMSKAQEKEFVMIQYIFTKASGGWQKRAMRAIDRGIPISKEEKKPLANESLIKQKIQEEGLRMGIRIIASSTPLLKALVGSFASFGRGDGNYFLFKKPGLFQKKAFDKALFNRSEATVPSCQVFGVSEIATLWHLPNLETKIPNLAWGKSVISEPPENLPAAINLTDEEKQQINFYAKTEFKNQIVNFGIKKDDRRRHMYIVGKTGTGKSTLIANMAIDDMKKGHGLAVIDAHGDLSEILLDYVPSHRINDVCYLDPSDRQNPFSLNILEVKDPAQAELIASGIVAIFQKLYATSWGPSLEYILRNTLLTLALTPNSTLVDVPRMLTDKHFRDKTVEKLPQSPLTNFWNKEFNRMPDRLREERISPILNKVGQFVTSPVIRDLIGHSQSTINLEEIMNQGKILLLNLSQGRLGEDNAALLGAMIITKFQQAAMNRVNITEKERKDFFLFVDEFQNFATESFIKILSEARKYRLNLCLANQYIAQIPEPVQKAIFGNTGTLMTFLVGHEDAKILEGEFGEIFKAHELVGLSNFQIINKLAIDNLTSRPFFAYTLPLPQSVNQNRQKVINVSRQRYSYK